MDAPWLEVNLSKIRHNAHSLVKMLGLSGIEAMGVTKAAMSLPGIVRAMQLGGITCFGEVRLSGLRALRQSSSGRRIVLLRSPMISQVDRVVRLADISFNTDLNVLRALSAAAVAAKRCHGIVLMVELGDLREGIMPADLQESVQYALQMPGLSLVGIGANLACRYGISPDAVNMGELNDLVEETERTHGISLEMVSGGSSSSLSWLCTGVDPGRINSIRLGEAILLGRDPLTGEALSGLCDDAFTLFGEVIECKMKPSLPWGVVKRNGFGETPATKDRGLVTQSIVALGRQDTDPAALTALGGEQITGSSSDHLMLEADYKAGDLVAFTLGYSALLRTMTSPTVEVHEFWSDAPMPLPSS